MFLSILWKFQNSSKIKIFVQNLRWGAQNDGKETKFGCVSHNVAFSSRGRRKMRKSKNFTKNQQNSVIFEHFLSDPWIFKFPQNFNYLPNEAAEELKKAEAEKDPFEGFLNPKDKAFPYAELKGQFPEGVKGDSKEWYLSDAEFETVMGMDKAKYGELKKWKQQDIKKKVGLFWIRYEISNH